MLGSCCSWEVDCARASDVRFGKESELNKMATRWRRIWRNDGVVTVRVMSFGALAPTAGVHLSETSWRGRVDAFNGGRWRQWIDDAAQQCRDNPAADHEEPVRRRKAAKSSTAVYTSVIGTQDGGHQQLQGTQPQVHV